MLRLLRHDTHALSNNAHFSRHNKRLARLRLSGLGKRTVTDACSCNAYYIKFTIVVVFILSVIVHGGGAD